MGFYTFLLDHVVTVHNESFMQESSYSHGLQVMAHKLSSTKGSEMNESSNQQSYSANMVMQHNHTSVRQISFKLQEKVGKPLPS